MQRELELTWICRLQAPSEHGSSTPAAAPRGLSSGAGGECSWHSPARDKAIKHGLVWLAEKMPLSVPIYRIRCRGPQRGKSTCVHRQGLSWTGSHAAPERLVRASPACNTSRVRASCPDRPRTPSPKGAVTGRTGEEPGAVLGPTAPRKIPLLSLQLRAIQQRALPCPVCWQQHKHRGGTVHLPRQMQPSPQVLVPMSPLRSRCPSSRGGASVCGRPPCAAVTL